MGGGIYGGFGPGTKGTPPPLSKNGDLRYDKTKFEGYILNESHPHGGSKAKFLMDVLGYTKDDGKALHKNIVNAIKNTKPTKTEVTPYGMKHTFHASIVGKNGKHITANIVVIIQKDNGRKTYKVVTIYPDKRRNSNERI